MTDLGSAITRVFRNFPVTVMVSAPFLTLVLPLAIVNANPSTGFICILLGLACASSLAVELLFLKLRPVEGWSAGGEIENSRHSGLVRIAFFVSTVSVFSDLAFAYFGGGTIFQQVTGQLSSSPIVTFTGLIGCWKFVGVALLVSSFLGKKIERRVLYRWLIVLTGTQVIVAMFTAIAAPLVGFLVFLAFFLVLFGVVGLKQAVALGVVILIAWPTTFGVRNQIRQDGGVKVSTDATAQDRLRFDLALARVQSFDVPVDIGQPGVTQMIRYGLVPRFLDPGRPFLVTGYKINIYLGGSATSADTFTPIGNIYFLQGPTGIPIYYGFWAFATVLLLKARGAPGPSRMIVLALSIAGPLGFASSYPDSVVGFLQNLVATVPIFLLLYFSRIRRADDTSRHADGQQILISQDRSA